METPKLEWESEKTKKEREIREANRAMDARAEACFERSWEEDPSVHHDHDSSDRPFRLRGNAVSEHTETIREPSPEQPRRNPQRRQTGSSSRRRNSGQQQRPRSRSGEKPRLKESVRSAPKRRSEFRKRLDAIRRIRIYLLIAAAILIIMGVVFALTLNGDSPPSAESSAAASEIIERGDDPQNVE